MLKYKLPKLEVGETKEVEVFFMNRTPFQLDVALSFPKVGDALVVEPMTQETTNLRPFGRASRTISITGVYEDKKVPLVIKAKGTNTKMFGFPITLTDKMKRKTKVIKSEEPETVYAEEEVEYEVEEDSY